MSTHDNAVVGSPFLRDLANGHPLSSLVAENEPARERLRALRDLEAALPDPDAFAAADASVEGLATTPDFHPGRPVPVGVALATRGAVLPHVVGNDVGCGMRLVALDGVTREDVLAALPALARHLRHMLFQGGRDVALTGQARRALLEHGLPGFLDALGSDRPGLLGRLDMTRAEADLERTCDLGSFHAGGIHPGFAGYAATGRGHSRDAIACTLGGGNHFLEIGFVERVADGAFARAAGLRTGTVTLCVHSGSLDFGQHVAACARDAARAASGDGRVMRLGTQDADGYLMGLANAGNFAHGNRLLLALVGAEAVRRATGRNVDARLVYDAAHNMAWTDGERVLHRKGACPARGPEAMAGTPYAHFGEPVILPGSMGDATWLLRGLGSDATLASSAHGAGRRLSRGEARREAVVPPALHVVGPVDLDSPTLKGRPDVLAEARARLAEEAPAAYRPVEAVVAPMEAGGVVARAARILPFVTAKG